MEEKGLTLPPTPTLMSQFAGTDAIAQWLR